MTWGGGSIELNQNTLFVSRLSQRAYFAIYQDWLIITSRNFLGTVRDFKNKSEATTGMGMSRGMKLKVQVTKFMKSHAFILS